VDIWVSGQHLPASASFLH